MGKRGHVGEKNTDLAVFHAPGEPAILWCDARRVAAPFGKATFIDDEHREGCLGCTMLRYRGKRVEHLTDQCAQFIADAVFVPGGVGEQALDGIRS